MNSQTSVPKFYKRWLADLVSLEDTAAFNCNSCFMLRPTGLTRDLGPFRPMLKCCTFHPFLPSFTLGALLKFHNVPDETMQGYLVTSRLTPLGAFPRQAAGTSICETGKNLSEGCAFLSTDGQARCTIHDFRPSTCAGYACRSNNGARGLRAWNEWEAVIKKFEWTLAHLAAFELGRTLDDIEQEFSSISEARSYFIRAYEAALELKVDEGAARDTSPVLR